MPERRFIFQTRLAEAGLPAADDQTMHFLWQIVDEGVLGASRHVGLAHDLIRHLIDGPGDPDANWARAQLAAAFVAATRGIEAPIVANAVTWLLAGAEDFPVAERTERIRDRAQRWSVDARMRTDKLVSQAAARLGARSRVVAFDYSSTVAAVIQALHDRGWLAGVVVPESRCIQGGRRYLEEFLPAGINVHFVADAALEHALEGASAVLFGAESLRCDGSFTNTIGSRPLARLAKLLGIPVYAAADLFKLDTRTYRGEFRMPALKSFDHLLPADLKVPEGVQVSTSFPELEVVPPDLVTAILTEHGPVPPAALWGLGRHLAEGIDREITA
jgi:translation initiation factor 2B subunit (eIF-2B alpha/beta/delta family)